MDRYTETFDILRYKPRRFINGPASFWQCWWENPSIY